MSNLIYEASVYNRTVSYKNFNGVTKEQELYFALDPIQLMQVIAGVKPKTSKSNNPALKGKEETISDEDQLKLILDLVKRSAGFPSDDGESWAPFEDFENTLVGKAFLTKLTSSDGDRKEFAGKVILDPFRAFVNYASSDDTNTPKEVQQFQTMLAQLENVFKAPQEIPETTEERRERLVREMQELDRN